MDHTEDLSARILLDNILSTDVPRTPVTRSALAALCSPRRSPRRSNTKHVGGQTPQDILRRSMKHKMRESITRKYQPAIKTRAASITVRKIDTPGQASMLLDAGDTPRNLLMNILHTDLARSPVAHEEAAAEEPQPSSANSSLTSSKHQSSELSGLDLPDVTIGNIASIAKGMRRKRPRRSLNVTAFEKRLKDGDDAGETHEQSAQEHSSLSLSSTSLSLKTPFVEARTERRGLQRRVANCQRVSEEEFSAAVNKMQMKSRTSFAEEGRDETIFSESFTLNLSKSDPDITADVVHSDTALYAKAEAMTCDTSVAPTQEKSTVMASQIQRQIMMRGEEHGSLCLFSNGEEAGTEAEMTAEGSPAGMEGAASGSEERSDPQVDEGQGEGAAENAQAEEEGGVDSQPEGEEGGVDSQPEGEEGGVDSQPEGEEGGADSQPEEDVETGSQSEEEEIVPDTEEEDADDKGALSSEPEDPGAADLQSEEEEIVPDSQEEDADDKGALSYEPEDPSSADLQSEEEEKVPDSPEEDVEDKGALDSEPEDPGAADLQSEEEEEVKEDEEEEEIVPYTQEEEDAADSQSVEVEVEDPAEHQDHPEDPAEAALADSQSAGEDELEEEDGELERDLEHISRRAHRSEGGVLPVTDAGLSESKAHSAVEAGSSGSSQPHIETSDMEAQSAQGEMGAPHLGTEPDDDKENSVHPSAADDDHQSDRESEDYDDEDSDVIPSKTPAFVRERREMLQPDNIVSPSVFMNVRTSFTANRTDGGEPSVLKPKAKRRAVAPRRQEGIPTSYLTKVFKHFARAKVSADVKPILKQIVDKYIVRLAEDLETYAAHAKRKTIDVEDVVLLLRRQGYVNDKVPVEVLIEKYLRMDQRKILIPIPSDAKTTKKR